MYLLSQVTARLGCILLLASGVSTAAMPEDKPSPTDTTVSEKDKVYKAGGDVKAPILTHYVEPDFASSSHDAYREGVVRLSAVVLRDGTTSDLHVLAGLNEEEDQKAIQAVGQWRFKPGTRAGQPVKVRVTVEVQFHLL